MFWCPLEVTAGQQAQQAAGSHQRMPVECVVSVACDSGSHSPPPLPPLQSAHLAVMDALMAVGATETVTAVRSSASADLLGPAGSWEDALLHWVNGVNGTHAAQRPPASVRRDVRYQNTDVLTVVVEPEAERTDRRSPGGFLPGRHRGRAPARSAFSEYPSD